MAVFVMNKFISSAFVMQLPCRKYTSFTVMHQTRTMRLLLEDHGKSKQASKQINQHQQTNSVSDWWETSQSCQHKNYGTRKFVIRSLVPLKCRQTIHHYRLFIPLCLYEKHGLFQVKKEQWKQLIDMQFIKSN